MSQYIWTKTKNKPPYNKNHHSLWKPDDIGNNKKSRAHFSSICDNHGAPIDNNWDFGIKVLNSTIEQYTEYEHVFDKSFVANRSTVFEYSSQF